jgi:hypothetical protein
MSFKRSDPLYEASGKTIQSSAKRRCDIQGVWIPTLTPLVIYIGPTPFRRHDRPSEHRRNKYGDIGSPWRIPLVGLKHSDKTQLILILKETDVTHLITSAKKRE